MLASMASYEQVLLTLNPNLSRLPNKLTSTDDISPLISASKSLTPSLTHAQPLISPSLPSSLNPVPADLLTFSTNVTFPAGSSSQVVSIPIINDLMFEMDESFEVFLCKIEGQPDAVLGIPNSGNVVIEDDDRKVIHFCSSGYC